MEGEERTKWTGEERENGGVEGRGRWKGNQRTVACDRRWLVDKGGPPVIASRFPSCVDRSILKRKEPMMHRIRYTLSLILGTILISPTTAPPVVAQEQEAGHCLGRLEALNVSYRQQLREIERR